MNVQTIPKKTYVKLWSVRLGALSMTLSGLQLAMPILDTTVIPHNMFCALSFFFTFLGLASRAVIQTELSSDDDDSRRDDGHHDDCPNEMEVPRGPNAQP